MAHARHAEWEGNNSAFRTDDWDLPLNPDFDARTWDRTQENERSEDAKARLEFRLMEEAGRALENMERLETPGQ